jgi:hypothetical protein
MKALVKKQVQERAKYCCEYCLAQSLISADTFSIEHIIPIAKEGTDDIENLAFSCMRCNGHKYIFTHGTDSVTGNSVPLYNPRKGDWTTHFQWSEDFSEIVGISPTGRATIVRLNVNRENLINLRKVLAAAGLHPPF